MTVENISWSISTKECYRPRRGRTRDLLVSSRTAHPTDPPRPAVYMWYKEGKPSNTFSKTSSENDQRHIRYILFKFPTVYIQRKIIWDGKKFKFCLTSFDGNFELNNVVVLLTDIWARHLWKVRKMTFVLYKASYDWKYCFSLRAHNSIIYDCERIIFVIFKDRRLTKMTMKTFKRKTYSTSRYSKLYTCYRLWVYLWWF